MRVVLQRVSRAEVRVGNRITGRIGPGVLVLLGVRRGDTEAEAEWLAKKIPALRIFPGPDGTFDRDLTQARGQILVVSQFTLYGDARKGRRPSFDLSEEPGRAEVIYEYFVRALVTDGWEVALGEFGAMMEVELVNDGPVTLILDRDPAVP